MDISVIIVNYNVREFLNNALTSLSKALAQLKSEIIVVDNASDDGSIQLVQKNFPAVTLIVNRKNLGFAKANNQALALAKGKFLLLINPDTLVQEDSLTKLITFLQENKHVGMVGCKILNPDGTFQLPCRRSFPTPWVAFTKTFGLSSLFPKSKLFAKYNLTYLDENKTYEVDAVSGSFMLVRREVYEKIGGLDESFFMYGEDLDWCFRVQQAGWKVYYVPITSIIHYKGESTKRSNIDELKVFYSAMQLFVEKYHGGTSLFSSFIYLGIYFRKIAAALARIFRPFLAVVLDALILIATILLGEYVRKQNIFSLPTYAYPWVFLVPAFIVVASLFFSGVYTYRKLSVSRSFVAVLFSFILISSLTAFEKNFAFSRAIMLYSGMLSLALIPGWRLVLRLLGLSNSPSRATLFGRRTVIVGINQSGQDVLKKLRSRIGNGYNVVGYVDLDRTHIGEKILEVEILGSVETLGKVIDDYKISEVIFSAESVSYSMMLDSIARNRNRIVNFRLVPNNLEVIIGKPSIDQLDEIPLIDIEYNIGKISNRIVKRMFDLVFSLFLLICIAPFVYFLHLFSSSPVRGFTKIIFQMPKVLLGKMSIVGQSSGNGEHAGMYRGKMGLTGIVQINNPASLSEEEKEQFSLYYAKNQSFLLDLEIIVKALQKYFRRT